MAFSNANSFSSILARRKLGIIGATLLGTSLTALALKSITPIYTTHAQILFDTHTELHTHAISIKSPINVQKALQRQNQIETNILETHKNGFKPLNIQQETLSDTANISLNKEIEPLVTSIRTHLFATPAKKGAVLNLSLSGKKPENIAKRLNALALSYIESLPAHEYTRKQLKTNNFLNILEKHIEKTRTRLSHFETQIANTAYTPLTIQNALHEKTLKKQQKLKALLTPLQNKNGTIRINKNAPALRQSKILQTLNKQKQSYKKEQAQLANRYGPKHPKMIENLARISRLEEKITRESVTIAKELQTELAQTQIELNQITEKEKKLASHAKAKHHKQTQQKLTQLKERVAEAEKLYQSFVKTNIKATEFNRPHIKLLTPATPPKTHSFPQIPQLLFLSGALFLIFSTLIAIFIERRRKGFVSARQVEDALHLPCFSLVPKATPNKKKPIADFVTNNPTDITSEAIRAIKLNLKLMAEGEDKECKVISVTSTLSGEGKSTIASWLARLTTRAGQRVILIDADLRRPSIHLALGLRPKHTLIDYLSGTEEMNEIINTSDKTGLHTILGRAMPSAALDLISSEKMDTLLRNLRSTYDLIIIDTPASLAVPDARALEKRSDLFLYCIAWNKTKRELVHNGISQFLKFSKPTIATVLTQVNPKKHVQFGYGTIEHDNENDEKR